MKTIKKLQSEIDDKITDITNFSKSDDPKVKRKVKPAKLRLAYLKMCKMYLESNPTESFIGKERDRLSNRIDAFSEAYVQPSNIYGTMAAKHRKEYEKEVGVTKIKKQLAALNYLLN